MDPHPGVEGEQVVLPVAPEAVVPGGAGREVAAVGPERVVAVEAHDDPAGEDQVQVGAEGVAEQDVLHGADRQAGGEGRGGEGKGTQPPTAVCKMEAQSEYAHVAYTFLHVWAPICMLSRCLATKISASELRRKFY